MAVIYSTAAKTARMTATRDYHANGTLEILTAADAVLATFGLDTDGGDIADDVWTLVFDSSTVEATGSGTAAKAQIKNSGGTAGITGLTVGTSGADITLDSVSITTGQDITLSSATITHAS